MTGGTERETLGRFLVKRSDPYILLVAVAALAGLLTPKAYSQTNDYPYQTANSQDVDPYDFYYLNCTSFVAWRLNRDAGTSSQSPPWFRDGMKGGSWGNAYSWSTNAPRIGFTVDQTPAVGAIAQWEIDECGGCTLGHVAYVESVNPDLTVNVSEYNFCVPYGFDTRSTAACNGTGGGIKPPRFIHIVSIQPTTVSNFFQANSNGVYTINCPTDNLVDAQFQLVNNSGGTVTFAEVAMSLVSAANDSLVATVATQNSISIPTSGVYQFPRSFLNGSNPSLVAGNYRLVAKVYNGAWIELAVSLPFTISARNNNCGTSTSSNPLVTALANTTQQVAWYYIDVPSAGWYIVNSSGNVLYLVGGNANVSGTIVWEPVNNYSAFLSYPAAGQNFSYITVAPDGRSVAFGATSGTTNPLVTALANTTQQVAWYYIDVPSAGWYIVNSSGNVLYLVGGNANVSGTIVWEPVNNYSAFLSYPAPGQNFSYVTVATNGQSVSFGSIQ